MPEIIVIDKIYLLSLLKVNIIRGCSAGSKMISVPDFPDDPDKGSHSVQFSSVIYIERNDFKEDGEKGYRRLTKDQAVGLRHAGFVIKLIKVVKKNGAGEALEIDVEASPIVDQVKLVIYI
jgi:glutaminyl-tRNA synthetase